MYVGSGLCISALVSFHSFPDISSQMVIQEELLSDSGDISRSLDYRVSGATRV